MFGRCSPKRKCPGGASSKRSGGAPSKRSVRAALARTALPRKEVFGWRSPEKSDTTSNGTGGAYLKRSVPAALPQEEVSRRRSPKKKCPGGASSKRSVGAPSKRSVRVGLTRTALPRKEVFGRRSSEKWHYFEWNGRRLLEKKCPGGAPSRRSVRTALPKKEVSGRRFLEKIWRRSLKEKCSGGARPDGAPSERSVRAALT